MVGGKARNLLLNGTMVLVTLLLMALLSEWVLRWFFPLNTGTSFQFRVPHPIYGWVLQSDVSYANAMDEATVHVRYNSAGWRDTEHAFEKPPSTLRLVVLGDSYMEAYSVNLEDAMPRQMEFLAGKDGRRLETINLGVGGYGTLQQYLVFDGEGRQYDPDIVLLGFNAGNDLTNNSFELESIVHNGTMKVAARPFLDLEALPQWQITQVDYEGAKQRFDLVRAGQDRWSLLRSLERESALVKALLQGVRKGREMVNGLNSERRLMATFGVSFCQMPPEYVTAWEATALILERLAAEVADAGATLVVFTVPAMYEVDADYRRQVQSRLPDGIALCVDDPPAYRRLFAILDGLNVDYVDLLPTFKAAVADSEVNLFRRSDLHWNEQGHALAAEQVYGFLVQRGLLNTAE